MSKKTFYTIEHNNPLAIRAFKDTVAGLAVAATPEKNSASHFESPSLFEDLQRALNKQNVLWFLNSSNNSDRFKLIVLSSRLLKTFLLEVHQIFIEIINLKNMYKDF